MRIVFLLFSLAIGGCSHTSVQTGWDGTSSSSSGASVGISGGGTATWLLIGIGLIAAGEYSSGPSAAPATPELDKSRRVNEQDCTQPIKDWSANLKCR
jgi:hypothetical protein